MIKEYIKCKEEQQLNQNLPDHNHIHVYIVGKKANLEELINILLVKIFINIKYKNFKVKGFSQEKN